MNKLHLPSHMRAATAVALIVTAHCAFANDTMPLQGDRLGRLFHTPQKRAVLDQLRDRNARLGPTQKTDSYQLNGIVRRSTGEATVWINDTAFHDRYPVAALGTRSAKLFAGNGKTVELRVGEEMSIVPTGATDKAR